MTVEGPSPADKAPLMRPTNQATVACRICNRKFLPDRLEKHMNICKKTSQKRRPAFDSKQQRQLSEGGDGPPPGTPASSTTSNDTRRSKAGGKGTSSDSETDSKSKNKSTWREQHEEFIRTVRAARGVKVDEPPPQTRLNENGEVIEVKKVPAGYVTCPHCDRNFNKGAADRHMPFCRDQKSRVAKSPQQQANQDEAMARFKARSKYKAPSRSNNKKPEPLKANGHSNQNHMDHHDEVDGLMIDTTISTRSHDPMGVITPTPPPPPLPAARRTPVKQTSTITPGPPATARKTPVVRSTSRARAETKKPAMNGARNKSLSPARRTRPTPAPLNVNATQSRVKARLIEQEKKNMPKTPVVKFKEKFPNRASILQNTRNLTELEHLMKRPDTMTNNFPRTVPGVRTGGMSPTKPNSISGSYSDLSMPLHINDSNSYTTRLKSRLEEVYIRDSLASANNGLNSLNSDLDSALNGLRGSTSGSSNDGGTVRSRNNSSEGRGSQTSSGLPRFCHQCGTKYPSGAAKYCYECGARRLGTVASFL